MKLLTAVFLAAVLAASARASGVTEGADFSNTFAGANLMPAGTTQVNGTVSPDSGGDTDFFKFANLQPGSTYLFAVSLTFGVPSYGVLDSGSNFLNGPIAYSDSMSGIVPGDGVLVVEVQATSNWGYYTVDANLQEGSAIPEPATLAVAGLALAALSLRRKRRR